MTLPEQTPRFEELDDEELLRALFLEQAFIPDAPSWCSKFRELSKRYRSDSTGTLSSASFWEEWRQLMRPFKQSTNQLPASQLEKFKL